MLCLCHQVKLRDAVMNLRSDHLVLRVIQVHQVSLTGVTHDILRKSSLHPGTVKIYIYLSKVLAKLFVSQPKCHVYLSDFSKVWRKVESHSSPPTFSELHKMCRTVTTASDVSVRYKFKGWWQNWLNKGNAVYDP